MSTGLEESIIPYVVIAAIISTIVGEITFGYIYFTGEAMVTDWWLYLVNAVSLGWLIGILFGTYYFFAPPDSTSSNMSGSIFFIILVIVSIWSSIETNESGGYYYIWEILEKKLK